MRFLVEWKKTADDELTAIWLAAESEHRHRITAAAARADRLLQNDPDAQGESREDNLRIMFIAPLVITFWVDAQTHQVQVLRVGRFG